MEKVKSNECKSLIGTRIFNISVCGLMAAVTFPSYVSLMFVAFAAVAYFDGKEADK